MEVDIGKGTASNIDEEKYLQTLFVERTYI